MDNIAEQREINDMRRLVQIAILCALVLPCAFLAPSLRYETLREEYRSIKKIDAVECSMIYALSKVGLNHRYTYLSYPNDTIEVMEDWGWRLDASTTVSTRPLKHGLVSGTGTVEYIGLEGGFYGLVGDDGEHYDPRNLPQEFAVDGLRVFFIVKICEDLVGIHMWGYIVDVIWIHMLP